VTAGAAVLLRTESSWKLGLSILLAAGQRLVNKLIEGEGRWYLTNQ
jgi:hypothetical protein